MPRQKVLCGEVVVVGGGVAGVCAALAAARHGAQTILVQDRPALGGNSSSEIGVNISGADYMGTRPGWREGGILEELRLEEAARNPERNPCVWDLILWEKVTAESNLTLLLNTHCTDATVDEKGNVTGISACQTTTEQDFLIQGKLFIDCTGDGRLGYEAGADYRMGREGPEEHNEPHAEGPDSYTMGASIMWLARDTGHPVAFSPPPWARQFPSDQDLPDRGHDDLEAGHWWIEYGGELDTIRDAEKIRDELLACMLGVWDHVKNRGDHGAENWALTWWNFLPGRRESRRLLGPYILTENDLLEARLFEDRIGHGGWAIDMHPPAGIFSPGPPSYVLFPEQVYSLPLRVLYSRNVPNLFMAGRCVSCTHMAMGSTRVMGTGAVMGQAAGTAAAICLRDNCVPGELGQDQIHELQQTLLRDDQFIPEIAAKDPDDLARQATVSASSESPGCGAAALTNGHTRELAGQSNQWRSDADQRLPQWLELSWPEPVDISEVHLTFASGFARPLALTQNDKFNAHMIRGPQPETARDYDIAVRRAGEWQTLEQAQGNYQRKRVHSLSARSVEALRLEVQATNGERSARVFEVRVY